MSAIGCVARGPRRQRRRHPRAHERQSLPMRGLSAHRRRDQPGQRPDAELSAMRPFLYQRAGTIAEAVAAAAPAAGAAAAPPTMAPAQYPRRRHDAARPDEARRDAPDGAGRHQRSSGPPRQRSNGARRRSILAPWCAWPRRRTIPTCAATIRSIAQSLDLAASPQLRNMATLGGNVLQRTRCTYFRDPSWSRLQQARTRAAAAPRSTASTASMRCSASAASASPPIPAISPRR